MGELGSDGRHGFELVCRVRQCGNEFDDDGKSLLCQICPLLPTVIMLT